MSVHRWKDAISLVEVLSKDQRLDAKRVLTSAALATEQQDPPHVELGLQYRRRSNTAKKIRLGFFFFFQDQQFVAKRFSKNSIPIRKIRSICMQFDWSDTKA